MKNIDKSLEFYQTISLFLRIGNKAVEKARIENKKLGIPNVFGKNGIIYYELPNGEITTEQPQIFKNR